MKTFLIFIISIFPLRGYCYQDLLSVFPFDNVKIRIKTGQTFVEDKNKAIILGQLCQLIAEENSYMKKLIIDIDHDYTRSDSNKRFVGFCDIDIYSKTDYPQSYDSTNCLRIYLRIREIEFDAILQLLNNSIKKIDFILTNQKSISVNGFKILALEEKNLNRINVTCEISENIRNTKFNRIIGDNQEDDYYSTSYYFQDNKFYLYGLSIQNSKKRDDTIVLASIPNIFQMERLNQYWVLVFDTDSSFYFLNNSYQTGPSISKKHIITKTKENYMTFEIKNISGYIFIRFYIDLFENGIYWTEERLLAYNTKIDKLIQDVKKKLDE